MRLLGPPVQSISRRRLRKWGSSSTANTPDGHGLAKHVVRTTCSRDRWSRTASGARGYNEAPASAEASYTSIRALTAEAIDPVDGFFGEAGFFDSKGDESVTQLRCVGPDERAFDVDGDCANRVA